MASAKTRVLLATASCISITAVQGRGQTSFHLSTALTLLARPEPIRSSASRGRAVASAILLSAIWSRVSTSLAHHRIAFSYCLDRERPLVQLWASEMPARTVPRRGRQTWLQRTRRVSVGTCSDTQRWRLEPGSPAAPSPGRPSTDGHPDSHRNRRRPDRAQAHARPLLPALRSLGRSAARAPGRTRIRRPADPAPQFSLPPLRHVRPAAAAPTRAASRTCDRLDGIATIRLADGDRQ